MLAASPQDDMLEDKEGDGDDDDDDGWGTTPSSSMSSSASSKSMAEMTKELRSLQQTTTMKDQSTRNTVQNQNDQVQQDGQERDLFIPIFAIVSLMGLFGSYGYEMVRLYSRGELYLPWMDN